MLFTEIQTMQVDGCTIIISTPEELLSLLIKALRAVGYEKAESGNEHALRKLLAPKEVEKEFVIHQKTLAYWRLEGVGPAYTNFGRRVFYERAVLEEYIASGRVQASDSRG